MTSIPDIKLLKDPKKKFDDGFYEKINNMKNSGETREYDVVILVKKVSENSLDAKDVAKKNKDKLVNDLLGKHKAKNVYKGQVLSFVSASIPLHEIEKLADYDYVYKIGDGEIRGTYLLDVAKQVIKANNLNFIINGFPVNGSGVKVSVIDSGIGQTHQDLPVGPKIINQLYCHISTCVQNGNYSDFHNHGTHVAGIIAGLGQINSSLKGVAPGASLLNVAISEDGMTPVVFGKALDWSITNGARVINIAFRFGGCGQENTTNLMVDETTDEGVFVSIAAGNFGPNPETIIDPACSFNPVSVGNWDDMNDLNSPLQNIGDSSSRGPTNVTSLRLKPEIVAPGTNINSPDLFLDYADKTGTSFAAPMVSGASALILQVHPEYSPLEIKAALLLGAKWNPKNETGVTPTASLYEGEGSSNPTLNKFGFGLLDVNKTLTYANSGKNIIKSNITQGKTINYTFSANAGEQVKVILSWLNHPGGNITNPEVQEISNLDLAIIHPCNCESVISSVSFFQNNEFVVFDVQDPGIYTVIVIGRSVPSAIGSEDFVLASTHELGSPVQVKGGSFAKSATLAARPDADISTGGWTVTPLWQKLDEATLDDSDFVTSPSGTAPEFEVRLSDVSDPNSSSDHIIKFRAKAPGGSGSAEKTKAILYQGTTPIADTGLFNIDRNNFVTHSYTLTTAQANAITDYTNLSIKIVTSKANSEVIQTSQIEFLVPDSNIQTIDVGFQPKALIVFSTGQTAEGFEDGYSFAMGFSDGIDSRSISTFSNDNVATSNTGRVFGTKLISLLSSGVPNISAEADLVGFNSNGFTIQWTTNDLKPSVINYLALGGDDITNAKVSEFTAMSSGQQNIQLGFQPDFLMFMHAASTETNGLSSNAYMSYGFASNSTGAIRQAATASASSDNSKPKMDTFGIQRDDRSIIALDETNGSIDAEGNFLGFNTSGFSIDWTNPPQNADKIYYLALEGGRYDIGSFGKTTATAPALQSVSSIGFKPQGMILSSINNIASTQVQPNNRLSFGTSDGLGQGTIWSGDTDNVSTSVTAHSTTSSKVIRLATEQLSGSSSTANAEAILQSFNDNGFELLWSTNDPISKQLIYVAFGSFERPKVPDPWNITSAVFAGEFSVLTQTPFPIGLFFKPDGTRMFIAEYNSRMIFQYDLSTAWDVTTASFVSSKEIPTNLPFPIGLFFKPDGTRMYGEFASMGIANVVQYDLSTAWDVTTASFNAQALSLDAGFPDIFFKPDGTRMYLSVDGDNTWKEYGLSTAWDVTTAVFSRSIDDGTDQGEASFYFVSTGKRMYQLGWVGDKVYEFDLTSAWNITTVTYTGHSFALPYDVIDATLRFKPDGTRMYVVAASNDKVTQYDMLVP